MKLYDKNVFMSVESGLVSIEIREDSNTKWREIELDLTPADGLFEFNHAIKHGEGVFSSFGLTWTLAGRAAGSFYKKTNGNRA